MKTLTTIRTNTVLAGLFCLSILLLAVGCATTKKPQPHVYFPGPPDEPRIQFLTSFSSEDELGGGSSFADFIVGTKKGEQPVVKPYGIAIAAGKIYICDTDAAAVEIVDLAKKSLRYFKPDGEARIALPINIAVDADGTRYVTDAKRNQVLVYSGADDYLGAIGTKDEMQPRGIALFKDRIYVTDMKSHCVRVYAKADRKLLFTFPKDQLDASGRLFSPTNLAIDEHGNVYVSDTGDFAVKVFDGDGTYKQTIGKRGDAPGSIALCKGVAVDRAGCIYVVDAKMQVVQLFDSQGRVLMDFGDPSTAKGGATALPAGIAINYDHLKYFKQYVAPGFKAEYIIILTNQVGNRKVSIFAFGKKS